MRGIILSITAIILAGAGYGFLSQNTEEKARAQYANAIHEFMFDPQADARVRTNSGTHYASRIFSKSNGWYHVEARQHPKTGRTLCVYHHQGLFKNPTYSFDGKQGVIDGYSDPLPYPPFPGLLTDTLSEVAHDTDLHYIYNKIQEIKKK